MTHEPIVRCSKDGGEIKLVSNPAEFCRAMSNALNLQRSLREGDEIHGVRIVSIEYPEATP
jgi:hypothetical protein